MSLITWIQGKLGIVPIEQYNSKIQELQTQIKNVSNEYTKKVEKLKSVEEELSKHMVAHIDYHYNAGEPNTVILVGKYHGRDIVKTFTVRESDIRQLMEMLSRDGIPKRPGRIDAPPGFSAVVEEFAYCDQKIVFPNYERNNRYKRRG